MLVSAKQNLQQKSLIYHPVQAVLIWTFHWSYQNTVFFLSTKKCFIHMDSVMLIYVLRVTFCSLKHGEMLDADATARVMLRAVSVDGTGRAKQKVRMHAGTEPGNMDILSPSPQPFPDGEKWGSPCAPSLLNLQSQLLWFRSTNCNIFFDWPQCYMKLRPCDFNYFVEVLYL